MNANDRAGVEAGENPTHDRFRLYIFLQESATDMVKLLVRDRESIQDAVRRFRKLVERSGIKKEMRRREFYEKPSEIKRRAKLRAERRNKKPKTALR